MSASRFALAGLLGAVALTGTGAGQAQEVRDVRKVADGDSNTLEVVIVTAQKRSEDIQTVPMSVTTLSGAQLELQHANQLSDFAAYVPGLQFESLGTPGQLELSLRGIPSIGASATVATYIDETPMGSSSNYAGPATTVLDLLPFDVQSFDVLRGPQGTLYGASSLGGLIKFVTKLPDLEHFSGRVGGDVFSLDEADKAGLGGRGSVNLPLITGELGLSASFARENTPGYIDNVQTGQRKQNDQYQQVGRVALLWKATEDISLALSGIQQKIESQNNSFVALDPVTLRPIAGNWKNNNYIPEPFDQDLDYVSATLNVNLGWADLISASGYSRNRSDATQDATLIYGVVLPLFGLPAGESAFRQDLQLRKITEEVRLTSKPGDRIEWLVGGFYTHENSQNNQLATVQNFDGTSIPALNPLAIAALPSIYREYAVFGDLTYKFNSSFDLSGGVRWARNTQDFAQISAGAILPTTDTPGTSQQSVVTYSVSPRWHINADTMAYLRVASGYQPGSPNVVLPNVPPSVGADKLTNYELGLKTLLDERRLLVDAAVYYIDWKDIQVLATNGVASYLVNGGTASSRGFELTTTYLATDTLRLGLTGSYSDAKLTQDVPSIGGLSGDRLPYVPKWSAAATADYGFLQRGAWTARVGGGLRYTGDRVTQVDHSTLSLPLKSYGALDLHAELGDDRWTFRLFAKNVTNRLVYIAETPLSNGATGAIEKVNAVPLEPRTVGFGFDVNF